MKPYKIVFLGKSSVGKSSIIHRFILNDFTSVDSTIGASYFSVVRNGTRFDIWDTAGQEKYKSLVPFYYKNSNVAVIVFDLTILDSINEAVYWIDQLKSQLTQPIIYLVMNKTDIIDMDYPLLLQTYDVKRFKTSAKTGEGVYELFHSIFSENIEPIEVQDCVCKKESSCCSF